MKKRDSIGVVILTYHAERHLSHCLPPFVQSPVKPRVLVVDSSSDDRTVEVAKKLGADVVTIPKKAFNHGSTREKARKLLGTDIVVMVTQDAYAKDDALEKLIEPLLSRQASVSYARQIPHEGADVFESFSRRFNYPQTSHIRGIEDAEKYGVYLFFCSNSCAAYSQAALDKVGGFRTVLFGEDTFAVADLLKKRHKIAYVAEAIVKHSHRYTLSQEFKRSFDVGLVRKQYRHLLELGGRDEKRGAKYVQQLMKELMKEKPQLIPYAFVQSLAKWAGYQVGRVSLKAPTWLKKTLSSQRFYWTSDDFLHFQKE